MLTRAGVKKRRWLTLYHTPAPGAVNPKDIVGEVGVYGSVKAAA